jgi:hypothetical protein
MMQIEIRQRRPWLTAVCGAGLVLGACGVDPTGPEDEGTAEAAQDSTAPTWSDDVWVPQTSWTSPTMATLGTTVMWTHPGAPDGLGIWYSEAGFFDPSGRPFGYDFPISSQSSDDQAALAAFGNRLYMVHTGGSWGDTSLWISSESGGGNWTSDARLPFQSTVTPAAVVYFGKLYVLGRAPSGSFELWSSATPGDTGSWTRWGTPLISTWARPSMAVYHQLVYIVFGDNRTSGVSYATFNGLTVSSPISVPVASAGAPCDWSKPSAATFMDRLQVVHSGCSNTDQTAMWHLSFDGTAWTPDQQVWGHWASHGFTLATTPWQMFVAHDASDGSGSLYYAYYQ